VLRRINKRHPPKTPVRAELVEAPVTILKALSQTQGERMLMMSSTPLNIISAGAAMGLVKQLLGDAVTGSFGAVGAMHDKFLAGEPCDILILASKQLDELAAAGMLAGSITPIGFVKTGIAVRADSPAPIVSDSASLRVALLAASRIYTPDMTKSTAGQHVAKMIYSLGIMDAVKAKLSEHPNGAIAMKTMAADAVGHPLGCTQATEILYTAGVKLTALLPAEYELSTLYGVAVPTRSGHGIAAQQLVEQLVNLGTLAARRAAGFECD
jgi:molybdate transport system substrate-binding protein